MVMKSQVINSLKRERRVCSLAIEHLESQCKEFEKRYYWTTDEISSNKFSFKRIYYLRFHYHLPPPILQSYIKTEFCSSYILLYQTESGNIKQKIGIMR